METSVTPKSIALGGQASPVAAEIVKEINVFLIIVIKHDMNYLKGSKSNRN